MTRPFFTKNRISQFEIFEQSVHHILRMLPGRLTKTKQARGHRHRAHQVARTRRAANKLAGKCRAPSEAQLALTASPQDIAYRFTIDCGTTFLFGHDVASLAEGMPYPPGHAPPDARSGGGGAQDAPHDRARAFARSLQEGLVLTAFRTRYGRAWPLLELGGDRVRPHVAVVDAFLAPIIAAALQRKTEGSVGSKDDVTLLEYLVTCTDGACSVLRLRLVRSLV